MQADEARGQDELPRQTIEELTDATLSAVEALYQNLHRYPELSMQETRTAGIVAERVKALDAYAVTSGVGGTGVVCVLRNGEGPTVALRADMDALPLEEKTNLPYASQVMSTTPDGRTVHVMHACGHDVHTASLVGAADVLARLRDNWRGTLLLLFQPAEESITGAEAMLHDGVFTRFPRPDVLLAQHDGPFPAGTVLHRSGVMANACTNLRVRIFGVGGHGALPETAVDPILIAAAAIVRLQAIVSREIPGRHLPVVTVGSIHAGARPNIIPDEATMEITLRSTDDAVLNQIEAAVRRIIAAEAEAARAPRPPEIEVTEHAPLLNNDAQTTARVAAAHRAFFGADRTLDIPFVGAASEDFSAFGLAGPDHFPPPNIPYCYWSIGATSVETWAQTPGETALEKLAQLPSPHSPFFAPDPTPTLRTGLAALTVAALEVLARP
jgi:hippurate hydrolase